MARLPTMVLVVDSVAAGPTKGEGLFEQIGMYSEHRNSRLNRGSLGKYITRFSFLSPFFSPPQPETQQRCSVWRG